MKGRARMRSSADATVTKKKSDATMGTDVVKKLRGKLGIRVTSCFDSAHALLPSRRFSELGAR